MPSNSSQPYLLAVLVSVPTVIIVLLAVRYNLFASPQPPSLAGSRVTPTLQSVTIFARHGNRAPYDNFPNYPYPLDDTKTWPYGRLQLTRQGQSQMYKLGAKFREMYGGFLSQNYKKEELMAYSTLTDRTLMSAQLFLAGLFPPHEYQLWNKKIFWQPVPVYPTYKDHIELTYDPQLCPVFDKARKKSEEEFNKEHMAEAAAILKNLEAYTGEKINYSDPKTVRYSLYGFWDTLNCAEAERLPLPAWTKKFYRQPMESVIIKTMVSVALATDDMIRLFQGQLFQEMIRLMEDKVHSKLSTDRRMYFYSIHDYVIAGMLSILWRSPAPLIVESGSALIFELHQDPLSRLLYVQVLFVDGVSAVLTPQDVNIPGCDSPCDFNTFKNITQKYYNIGDWEQECMISE